MKYAAKLLAFLIGSLFSFVCYSQGKQIDSIELFNKGNFYGDTLYITTRFMECGEWGGHLELSKIYVKGNDFYLNYQKYVANCDTIRANVGEPSQTLIQTIDKKLLVKDIALIHKYAHELMEAKFREPEIMHAGYIFELKTAQKDLYIHVYTWGNKTKDKYLSFIKALLK